MIDEQTTLNEQLERARVMGEVVYSKVFDGDAYLLRFLLDRLERVEKANGDAYDSIRKIDWCL